MLTVRSAYKSFFKAEQMFGTAKAELSLDSLIGR